MYFWAMASAWMERRYADFLWFESYEGDDRIEGKRIKKKSYILSLFCKYLHTSIYFILFYFYFCFSFEFERERFEYVASGGYSWMGGFFSHFKWERWKSDVAMWLLGGWSWNWVKEVFWMRVVHLWCAIGVGSFLMANEDLYIGHT